MQPTYTHSLQRTAVRLSSLGLAFSLFVNSYSSSETQSKCLDCIYHNVVRLPLVYTSRLPNDQVISGELCTCSPARSRITNTVR